MTRAPKNSWTPERTALLIEMWNAGKGPNLIANALGDITPPAVFGKVQRLGLPPHTEAQKHGNKWPKERAERAKKLYLDGRSFLEIAVELGDGVTRSMVAGKIARLGIMRDTPSVTKPKRAPSVPRRPYEGMGANFGRPVPAMKPPKPPPKLIPSLSLPLTALTSYTCKFPTDGDGHQTLFCGHPTDDDCPYCPAHRKLCWGGLPKNSHKLERLAR